MCHSEERSDEESLLASMLFFGLGPSSSKCLNQVAIGLVLRVGDECISFGCISFGQIGPAFPIGEIG